MPDETLALLRQARAALRAMLAANSPERLNAAFDKARAANKAITAFLKPAPPAPLPLKGEELFPPDYFMPDKPQPAPGLEDCLVNPLEPDGPPAGREALIARLLQTRPQP